MMLLGGARIKQNKNGKTFLHSYLGEWFSLPMLLGCSFYCVKIQFSVSLYIIYINILRGNLLEALTYQGERKNK